jgi:hypothetical protein
MPFNRRKFLTFEFSALPLAPTISRPPAPNYTNPKL